MKFNTNTNTRTKPRIRISPIAFALKQSIFVSAFSLLSLGSAHANQQDLESSTSDKVDIESIVVTADLSQRNLSELPATALVLGQDEIRKRQARHLQDMVNMVPNLNFSAGASRGKFIQIRGIGERSQFAEPINPSIGLMLDDIDISGLGGLATVYDLRQVEVLSGPQSVATGLNSLGGIIKLVSNEVIDDQYFDISASYAQFNEHRIAGTYNNSLTENVAARFSLQNTQSDGFVKNAFLGRSDTDGTNELSASARINIDLSEDGQLDASFYHFDIENGYDAFSLDNDNVSQADEPGFDNIDAQAASLKYSHNFGGHSLQTTIAGINATTAYGYDEDWTFPEFHPSTYKSFDLYTRDIQRRSLDIKFASRADVASTSSYLVGMNTSRHEEDLQRIYTFEDDYASQYKPSNISIYGQYEAALSEKLGLTVAARAEQFEADFFDNQGLLAELDDNLFAASIGLDYDLSGNLAYANVSRGYKAGGFNIDQRLPAASRAYKPEFNINYEFGLKGDAYDGMANLSLTVFYMQRDDAQVSDFVIFNEFVDDGSADGTTRQSFADAIGNAGSGINRGIEVSSTWDINDDWYVVANVGYLDATLSEYTQSNGNVIPLQEQAQAPKYTGYLSSSYRINEQFSWFIDLDVKDDHRFSDGHEERSPFTAVVNSELAWDAYSFQIKLWVKNMFDRQVFTRGFGGFSNDPRAGYAIPEPYYQFGQARQVGITFTYTSE